MASELRGKTSTRASRARLTVSTKVNSQALPLSEEAGGVTFPGILYFKAGKKISEKHTCNSLIKYPRGSHQG